MTENMDYLGNLIKNYERFETDRKLDTTRYVYARIDGRGFSKFTQGMEKPFDERLSKAMQEITLHIVRSTGASIGYTQSDEINIGWTPCEPPQQMFFDGKVSKLTSVLAGMATASLWNSMMGWDPLEMSRYGSRRPHFDARVFNLPDEATFIDAFKWRELDATRNAVQMLAQELFEHHELHGKTTGTVLRMLWEQGIDMTQLPVAFRRGLWFTTRGELEIGLMRDMVNPADVLLRGKAPILTEEPEDSDDVDEDRLVQG